MAKAKLTVGTKCDLDYSQIYWPHGINTRVSVGDPLADLGNTYSPEGEGPPKGSKEVFQAEGLVLPLMRGWQARENVQVMTPQMFADLHYKHLPEAERVEQLFSDAHAERQRQIVAWEESERTKGMANVAKRVWFPNGKPEIVAVGTEAFRRSIGIMGAVYKRTLPPISDDSLVYPVGVVVVGFATQLDALTSHVLENTGKDAGKRPYGPLDFLKIALLAWEADRSRFNEATLVKMGISRGTAQKVFAVAQLAVANPSERIAERCFMAPPREGEAIEYRAPGTNGPEDIGSYLPLQRFDKEVTRRVAQGYDVDDTAPQPGGQLPAGQRAENVRKLLSRVSGGKLVHTVRMSATAVGSWEASPVFLLQEIAKAIAANDAQFIKTLETEANAAVLNEAFFTIFPEQRGESKDVAKVA